MEALETRTGEDAVILSTQVKAELKCKPQTPTYYSGLGQLDHVLGGFKEGEVIVVAAPTGQGKTLFLQTLTDRFAKKGINGLWFSYEVGLEDLIERFGNDLPVFAVPRKTIGASIEWLETRIWEGKAKFNTKVVYIDQLHFLVNMGLLSKSGNTSLAIGVLMRDLKRIALETNTIIFLATHLTKTDGRQSTINDIRDSSFIAQEADIVLLLNRTTGGYEVGGDDVLYLNEAKLRIDKNRRKGTLKSINLYYENGRFQETSTNNIQAPL